MRAFKNFNLLSCLLWCGIVLSCGLGAWLSGDLIKQHDDVWGQGGANSGLLVWLCSGQTQAENSCTASRSSAWSTLTVPIPTRGKTGWMVRHEHVPLAFFSLAYFASIGIWFIGLGGIARRTRGWNIIPLAGFAVGGLASLGLIALMGTGRAPWCQACIAIHVINAVMIITALIHWRTAGFIAPPADPAFSGQQIPRPAWVHRQAVLTLGFTAFVMAGLWMYRSAHLSLHQQWRKMLPYKQLVTELRNDEPFLLREHFAQPRFVEDGSPEPAGPTLVLFTDYDCASCACAGQRMIRQAREAFGDDLTIEVRHYPLCSACNPRVDGPMHADACDAAYAAEAARAVGGDEAFWNMHDRLYVTSGPFNEQRLAELAVKLGVDRDQFLTAFRSGPIRQRVADDIAMGVAWGVTGTPTLFLDGRRIQRQFEGPALWQALAGHWHSQQRERLASAQ